MKGLQKMWKELGMDLELHDQLIQNQANLHKKTLYFHEIWRNRYIRVPNFTNVPQPFTARVYWDVSPDGKIIIGFSENYTIEIYDSEKGKLSSFSHSYDPVTITEEDKKKGRKNEIQEQILLGWHSHFNLEHDFRMPKTGIWMAGDGRGRRRRQDRQ